MLQTTSLLKKPFFRKYQQPWKWPAEIDRAPWRAISFTSNRGARLAGLYAPALRDEPKATIVLAHPMAAEAKGYVLKSGHAALLRRAGYNVLAFDFNGFGESAEGGFDYPGDVLAAGRVAEETAPGGRVGLLGLSFGAGFAVCALSHASHPFRAVVLDSAFTSLPEFWRSRPPAAWTLKAISLVRPDIVEALCPLSCIETMTRIERLMLIYGTLDRATPPDMGHRLLSASPLPSEKRSLWLVENAKHCKAIQAGEDQYAARVADVFDGVFCSSSAS